MPRVPFVLVLVALALGGALAFAAAAGQAAVGPPPLLAAKAAGPPASAAAAATSADDGSSAITAGERIGEIIKSWGSALLLGIAGLMGLAVLARRSIAEGLVLLVVVLIVGGFVYGGEDVKGLIQSVWSQIGGG